jgi:hypothetical protein
MRIIEIIEQAKTRANLKSDYALSKAMGINTGIVSNWKKGKQSPSDEESIQLATLAGLDEMQVIAWIKYESASNPKKREFWKNYIESRGIAAAICMTTLAASIVLKPNNSEATVLHLQNYEQQKYANVLNTIYIMRIM